MAKDPIKEAPAKAPVRNGGDSRDVPHALQLEFIKFLTNPPKEGLPASLKDAATAVALEKLPSGSNPIKECLDGVDSGYDRRVSSARDGFQVYECCISAMGGVIRCAGRV